MNLRRPLALILLLGLLAPGAAFAKGKRGKGGKAPNGESLFQENCGTSCHGNGGRGDGANAGKLSPPPADLTKSAASEADIAAIIRDGKGTCPKWRSSFSDDEIAAIAKWAHSLQKR